MEDKGRIRSRALRNKIGVNKRIGINGLETSTMYQSICIGTIATEANGIIDIRRKCLLSLWKFIPTYQHHVKLPLAQEMQILYGWFVRHGDDTLYLEAFDQAKKKYGYPWENMIDTEGGHFWAVALARAALALNGFIKNIDGKSEETRMHETKETVRVEIWGIWAQWQDKFDGVFEKAKKLNDAYRKEQWEIEAASPKPLDPHGRIAVKKHHDDI